MGGLGGDADRWDRCRTDRRLAAWGRPPTQGAPLSDIGELDRALVRAVWGGGGAEASCPSARGRRLRLAAHAEGKCSAQTGAGALRRVRLVERSLAGPPARGRRTGIG